MYTALGTWEVASAERRPSLCGVAETNVAAERAASGFAGSNRARIPLKTARNRAFVPLCLALRGSLRGVLPKPVGQPFQAAGCEAFQPRSIESGQNRGLESPRNRQAGKRALQQASEQHALRMGRLLFRLR